MCGNRRAGADELLSERIVEEAEAVPRLHIGERQGEQIGSLLDSPRRVVLLRRMASNSPSSSGPDEGELLEKRMTGREAAEDLRHGLRDPEAHRDEIVDVPVSSRVSRKAGFSARLRPISSREVGTPNSRFSATVA